MSYKTQLSYFISRHETKFHCAPNKAIGKNDTDREKNCNSSPLQFFHVLNGVPSKKIAEKSRRTNAYHSSKINWQQSRDEKRRKNEKRELSRLSVIF
ncbi:hypothetical protein CEXT_441221 [Caerostris extrusa]|uniref:Uncharacterized protein n=1 Tax=Caerostris extrusa TaxID=172846 RepID=A0AAV4S4X0_CAEEX|nr:hypothetical protein CEXT_441221 [Caerostris extrusa]